MGFFGGVKFWIIMSLSFEFQCLLFMLSLPYKILFQKIVLQKHVKTVHYYQRAAEGIREAARREHHRAVRESFKAE